MKKSVILGVLGMAAYAASSYGQGTVNFNNYASGSSPTVNYAATGVPAGKANQVLGGSFAAELAWFNGTTAIAANLSLVPASLTFFGGDGPNQNSDADGDASAGSGWFFGPGTLVLGNLGNPAPAGTVVTLEVFAFDTGSLATSTINGHSALFQVTLGGGIITPPQTVGVANGGSFTVASVPEPTTLALAGLGGLASLVMLRRKNA